MYDLEAACLTLEYSRRPNIGSDDDAAVIDGTYTDLSAAGYTVRRLVGDYNSRQVSRKWTVYAMRFGL